MYHGHSLNKYAFLGLYDGISKRLRELFHHKRLIFKIIVTWETEHGSLLSNTPATFEGDAQLGTRL